MCITANAFEVRVTHPNRNGDGSSVVRTFRVRTQAEREALFEEYIREFGVDVDIQSDRATRETAAI